VGIDEDQTLKLGGKASNSAAPMRLRSAAAVLIDATAPAAWRSSPPRGGLVLGEQLGRRAPTGLVLEVEIAERLAGGSLTMKHASLCSSTIQGGGKRRMGVMIAPFPLCAESDARPS